MLNFLSPLSAKGAMRIDKVEGLLEQFAEAIQELRDGPYVTREDLDASHEKIEQYRLAFESQARQIVRYEEILATAGRPVVLCLKDDITEFLGSVRPDIAALIENHLEEHRKEMRRDELGTP